MTPTSTPNAEVIAEKQVVSQVLGPAIPVQGAVQPSIPGNNVEPEIKLVDDTLAQNESAALTSNVSTSFLEAPAVVEDASAIAQKRSNAGKMESPRIRNNEVEVAVISSQVQDEAKPVQVEPMQVAETSLPIEPSKSAPVAETEQVSNTAKYAAHMEANQATMLQAEQPSLKADQEKTAVASKQVTKQPENASAFVPAILSVEAEPITQKQTQAIALQASQQLPQAEIKDNETKLTVESRVNESTTESTLVPEKVIETSKQPKVETSTSPTNTVGKIDSKPPQVPVESLEISVRLVESRQMPNEADIKVSEVKVPVAESKEQPGAQLNSANRPGTVVPEITASTPSGNDVVMPVASRANISAVKDTVKVKQAGKDEETTPTEKEPKLNQMSGSFVAAIGPNKEAVAVERTVNQPSMPVNAQAVEVAQQVIRHFTANLKTESNAMHLQLNPKELGAIDIQMVSNGQGVHVSFVAEQASTSKLLETQLPQLRESLTAAGVQLSGLDISQHNQSGQKGGGFSQQPNAAPWPNEIFVEENRNAAETSAVERRFGQTSEVDYLI